jgi:hypothetical protein
VQCSYSFGMPVSPCQTGVDQQAMTVLHQPMPDEAQLGLLAFALAVEPGFGIGGRSMAVVRAFLAMEVRFGVAPAACAGGSPEPSFGLTLFIEAQASISVPSTEK